MAAVSTVGLVTAVGSGDVDITATYQGLSGKAHLTVTRGGFNPQIRYDSQVSSADRQIVEDGIAAAQTYFTTHFGRGVQGTLSVNVMASSACSAGGSGEVFGTDRMDICTLNYTWTSRIQNSKTMAHEMFHLLQHQNGWPASYWSKEGSAEFVGYAVNIARGLESYQEVHDCEINNWVGNGRAMDLLAQVGPSTPNGGYALSWLAWDLLLGGLPGTDKISGYLNGATFEQVFGLSEAELDARFTPYRLGLQSSTAGSAACDRTYRLP